MLKQRQTGAMMTLALCALLASAAAEGSPGAPPTIHSCRVAPDPEAKGGGIDVMCFSRPMQRLMIASLKPARARGDIEIDINHLLKTMLDDNEARAALVARNVDVRTLATAVDRALDAPKGSADPALEKMLATSGGRARLEANGVNVKALTAKPKDYLSRAYLSLLQRARVVGARDEGGLTDVRHVLDELPATACELCEMFPPSR